MDLALSTSGYDTMCAVDGYEALEKMRVRRRCVVLLDLQMPRMDGWTIACSARRTRGQVLR
jgi:CheY-like chemotaxis protein